MTRANTAQATEGVRKDAHPTTTVRQRPPHATPQRKSVSCVSTAKTVKVIMLGTSAIKRHAASVRMIKNVKLLSLVTKMANAQRTKPPAPIHKLSIQKVQGNVMTHVKPSHVIKTTVPAKTKSKSQLVMFAKMDSQKMPTKSVSPPARQT